MKQLLQSLRDGSTQIAEVPAPKVSNGQNLIRTSTSLVSAGTERMLVAFGKGNFIQKARSQPDKVKMVLEKAKTDGFVATIDAVRSKLDQPIPLGYCNVGTIIDAQAEGFAIGDRVVSNGYHAEIVAAPKHLCARVPDNVTDEQAAFTVLGSIGLQGIRLAAPNLGETFVVMGLGLIGLLTVQILRAHGCQVIGIDLEDEKLALAKEYGASVLNARNGYDNVSNVDNLTGGIGADGVIITAATKSNDPISISAQMCRKRARIILVGVVGLDINRADFYEKELTFQVSCSYGAGRYDTEYEDKGRDYPIGYVRWTEQRNFQAILELMSLKLLNVEKLISHRFDFEQSVEAMDVLANQSSSLGILLNFQNKHEVKNLNHKVEISENKQFTSKLGGNVVSFLGAGNYASRVLIPAFKKAGVQLNTIVSNGGVSSNYHGRKNGFKYASSDEDDAYEDPSVDVIVIATRHDLHAGQVIKAIRARKNVYCEKPLCLTIDELDAIKSEIQNVDNVRLMVGFNRRFAPLSATIKSLILRDQSPKTFLYTINAGKIPNEHWIQDPFVGGRRIIGEVCHFIDYLRFLAGHQIIEADADCIGLASQQTLEDDNVSIRLKFADGSLGVINYISNGHKDIPKEFLEIWCNGKVIKLDNFLRLKAYGWNGVKTKRLLKQNKGQHSAPQLFLNSIKEGYASPIPSKEIFEVTEVSINLARKFF